MVHWIWLASRQGLNAAAKAAVLQYFQDPEDVYYAQTERYAQVEGLTEEAVLSLADKDLTEAENVILQCEEKKIQLLTYQDAMYPNRLRNIADPPLVLYYRGRLPEFDAVPVIAVVGTREATAYGLSVAKRMGAQIARCGGLVVSGLAVGIDSMAMRGALSAGGSVVGVMGCGVDVGYPAANRSLLLDTQQRGCLISEFPPGTPPLRWNFPKRNRIISGLACGVLVVEAPEKSGALITAGQAADQGRDVFVVPGNVDVDTCAGSNALLRDGAIAVCSGWDIMSEYQQMFPGKVRRNPLHSRQTIYPDELAAVEASRRNNDRVAQRACKPEKEDKQQRGNDKKGIDNTSSTPYSDVKETDSTLTPDERCILGQLNGGDRLVDDLIADSGLRSGDVLSALTLLEVKGLIARRPGRYVCLVRQKP